MRRILIIIIPTGCLAAILVGVAAIVLYNYFFIPRPPVRWETEPNALVFEADLCCGMAYNPNGIPTARLWGDGRLIWTQYDNDHIRQVRVASLTPAEMKTFLQSFVDAGFFGWQANYAPVETVYDAPSTCMRLYLTEASKSVCEIFDTAPSEFSRLYAQVSNGAGFSGNNYRPSTGYLTATLQTYTAPPLPTVDLYWPVDSLGFSLAQATGGRWVEGEALELAWRFINGHPNGGVIQDGPNYYGIVLLISEVTRQQPPPP